MIDIDSLRAGTASVLAGVDETNAQWRALEPWKKDWLELCWRYRNFILHDQQVDAEREADRQGVPVAEYLGGGNRGD